MALRTLTRYFEIVTGSPLTPVVIAAIQTFGNRINLHPHLHFLVIESGVDEEVRLISGVLWCLDGLKRISLTSQAGNDSDLYFRRISEGSEPESP